MLRRLRTHLTYANVMSSIAAFAALTGVAWAATLPRNSVGPAQLKNNAVTSPKIKNGQVTTADAKDNTFTGADVNEGSLGQVPSAASADNAANAVNAVNAANATNATNATNAVNATNATNAANATSATTATNAEQLGGAGPEAYNVGRAYAYVNEEGGLAPGRSRNVVSAVKPVSTTGLYCVTLAPGIDTSTIAPIVSLDKHDDALTVPPSGPGDDFGILEWDSVNEDCPAGQLEFDSFSVNFDAAGAHQTNTRSDQSFMFLIP